jgi:DNA-binding protein H-NS
MATLENLQAKIAQLQAQAEAIVKKDSTAVIAKIHRIMEKHGLTVADIEAHIGGGKKRGRKPGVKSAAKSSASTAKYRDPKTGATWTGHGRAPKWIASAKDRSTFLIESNAVASAPATKKAAKAGAYVRGPQPALYADPKTGATWSGRGRAPAWLAGAKDRSNFLIARASEGKAETKTGAVKKAAAPAKKAAAKKVANKKVVPKTGAAQKVAAGAKNAPARKAAVKNVVAKKAPNSRAESTIAPVAKPEAASGTAST